MAAAAAAASKWNTRPEYTAKPLLGAQVSRSAALQSVASYAAVALVAAATSRYGLPLLSWLHVPHVTTIGAVLAGLVLLGLVGAAGAVLRWRDSSARAKAQAGLDPAQRKLLGLPPTPPPKGAAAPEAAPAAARAATLLATPVTPAQRMAAYTPVSDVAPRQLLATPGSAGHSSWTASPTTRMSPWSAGRAVATSDQLNRYLNAYATPPTAATPPGASPLQQQQQQQYTPSQQQQGPSGYTPASAGGGGAGGGVSAGRDGARGAGGAAGFSPLGGGGGGGGVSDDQGVGGAQSPALPLGRDAPFYRPSLWPRKAATVAGSDGLGAPSADTTQFMEQVLRINTRINAPTQMTWIEHLREWMASELLQPLAGHILSAHELPNQAIAARAPNSRELLLPSIPQLLGLDAAAGQQQQQSSSSPSLFGFGGSSYGSGSGSGSAAAGGAGGLMLQAWNFTGMLTGGGVGGQNPNSSGAGVGGGVGGGAGGQQQGGGSGSGSGSGGQYQQHGQHHHAAAAVDDAISRAQQYREQLYGQQLMQGFDPQEMRMALHRYAELLLLLTGRRPSELLPPTPPSYIVNRVWQLAQSTCVKDFEWNGGGEHGGHPWTPELPSDSALLFYLFAAFVAAPGWNFPPPGAGGPDNSRGAPLYVGSVPGAPPAAYSALLAYKPDKPGPGAAAMVASQMASREPRFSLLLLGHQFTLSERDGFFKVLLWWLRYHLVERQGLLGGRYLGEEAFGGLQDVLDDADTRPTIPQRVFNWWYPATAATGGGGK